MILALLLACGVPAPPPPPGSGGGGGGGGDDSAEPDTCIPCEGIDCDDDTPPDVLDEEECAEAAAEQGCSEYVWTEC